MREGSIDGRGKETETTVPYFMPVVCSRARRLRAQGSATGAGQHYFGDRVRLRTAQSSIEIPLPEIGRKHLVHIHVGTAQRDTGSDAVTITY